MPQNGSSAWFIEPSPNCPTGVPKPDWYDKPHEEWPSLARQYYRRIAKGVRYHIAEQAYLAAGRAAKRGERVETLEQITAQMNEGLKGYTLEGSVAVAWPWLDPEERKQLVQEFVELFNVDVIVFRDRRVELRYPRSNQRNAAAARKARDDG